MVMGWVLRVRRTIFCPSYSCSSLSCLGQFSGPALKGCVLGGSWRGPPSLEGCCGTGLRPGSVGFQLQRRQMETLVQGVPDVGAVSWWPLLLPGTVLSVTARLGAARGRDGWRVEKLDVGCAQPCGGGRRGRGPEVGPCPAVALWVLAPWTSFQTSPSVAPAVDGDTVVVQRFTYLPPMPSPGAPMSGAPQPQLGRSPESHAQGTELGSHPGPASHGGSRARRPPSLSGVTVFSPVELSTTP